MLCMFFFFCFVFFTFCDAITLLYDSVNTYIFFFYESLIFIYMLLHDLSVVFKTEMLYRYKLFLVD